MSNKELPVFTRVADERIAELEAEVEFLAGADALTSLERQLAELRMLLLTTADGLEQSEGRKYWADRLRNRVAVLLKEKE